MTSPASTIIQVKTTSDKTPKTKSQVDTKINVIIPSEDTVTQVKTTSDKTESCSTTTGKKAIPLWMQWDKKKEESVDVEQEEDGGIIEREPKQKAKFGRRQILQE